MSKILIIEDDVMFARDLKYLIEAAGHECSLYEGDAQVRENWEKLGRFDTIILDLMMMRDKQREIEKGQARLETGEIVFNRIVAEHPNKKIIIVTAKNEDDIQLKLDKYPHVKVIVKPLNEHKVRQLLEMF